MTRRALVAQLLVAAAASAAWCMAAITLVPPSADSPHWSPDGCASCHRGGPPQAIPHADTAELCLSCHDGSTASAEAHPIARPVDGDSLTIPSGWPTVNDTLTCLTCHDALMACREEIKAPGDNRSFLRGLPPFDRNVFCARCHDTHTYAKRNPHLPQGPEGKSDCAFCHEPSDLTVSNPVRMGARLVADEVSLCGACHREHVDFFEPGHINATVTASIRSQVAATSRDLGFAGDGQNVLPFADDERIVCSTCHNPHPMGMFSQDSILSVGAMHTGDARSLVSLRLPERALCAACHGS